MTDNEAELASVMAHETGHVVQRHMARADCMAESASRSPPWPACWRRVLIGAASGGNGGEAIEGAIAMGQAIAMQQMINFTRSAGDRGRCGRHSAARRPPASIRYEMADFLRVAVARRGSGGPEIPALLQDHPVTSERIAAARAARRATARRCPCSPSRRAMRSSRSACGCWSPPPEARLAQYYASIRDRRALTPAERYGEALVQMQNGQCRRPPCRRCAICRHNYPQLIMLYSALGQALAAAGQTGCGAGAVRPLDAAVSAQCAADRALRRDAHEPANRASRRTRCCSTCSTMSSPPRRRSGSPRSPPAPPATRAMPTTTCAQYELAGGHLALANQQLELALAAPNLTNVQRERFRGAARRSARLAARAAGLAPTVGRRVADTDAALRPSGSLGLLDSRPSLQKDPLVSARLLILLPLLALTAVLFDPAEGAARPPRPVGARQPLAVQLQHRGRSRGAQAGRSRLREGHALAACVPACTTFSPI